MHGLVEKNWEFNMSKKPTHQELEDALQKINWGIKEGLIDESTVEDMTDEELVDYAWRMTY